MDMPLYIVTGKQVCENFKANQQILHRTQIIS
jgi:hypothetical protein